MSTPYSRVEARDAFPTQGPTIGELLTELTDKTGILIRQEVKLAGAELTHKATLAGRQVAFIAAGALLATLGLLLLLQSLVIGLGEYMPLWLSALLVGIAVCAGAAALASKGIATLRGTSLKPEQTLQSLQTDKKFLQGQAK
jgi:hypothetical protein